nr:cold-regulated 47 [Tanacetum cinerariifolium]
MMFSITDDDSGTKATVAVMAKRRYITDIKFVLTQKALTIFCETYHIPDEVHPQLPKPNQTIHEMHSGKICVYTRNGFALFHSDRGPYKSEVAERHRVENEPRLLESTVGRVVSLLLIAPARASGELEASVDKLFDDGASGDGQGTDIQPVVATSDTIVEDVAPLQPRHQRKRKIVVADASGPSHPPKKLREDYGALGGAPTAATPEREDKSPADSVTGLNLRTIGAPQRSYALAIATVTTVTASVEADATADRVPVTPFLFGVGSSSTGRTDSVPGGFSDVSGSDFLIGGIRTVPYLPEMLDEFAPLKFFASVRGMDHDQLFTEFNVGAVRQISLSTEVRDGEIESLKAQLLLKEAEATEAIRLRAEVHELEISSAGLQEKVVAYEDFIGQLEKFQDKKMEEVNEKFDKLCADFVDMALHLEEKFYLHLLTTIFGRRWLLTYGMELAVVKCLNSTEYLSALGAAISKTVENGMQEGLSTRITHGAEGRKLVDVAAYNPSAKADYLFALQRLQNVNFSLIAELKSNKDASVDTIMNLLRLDEALTERLGLTESQPHANQLMVPIHHSSDQRVVSAFALSLSLYVSHSRVRKIRENIASHVSALRGVFVPLSVAALEGTKGTSGSTHDTTTTLSMTFAFASTIPPIYTDDYEVAHADVQGVPVWMTKP